MLKFNRYYFTGAVLLFGVEVLIAAYAHDRIVRGYVGDLLVVILMYCLIKAFFDAPVLKTALAVLLFSYGIEILQYFHIVNRLGLQHSEIASVVIGTSFEWIDLIAYTVGIALMIWLERLYAAGKSRKLGTEVTQP